MKRPQIFLCIFIFIGVASLINRPISWSQHSFLIRKYYLFSALDKRRGDGTYPFLNIIYLCKMKIDSVTPIERRGFDRAIKVDARTPTSTITFLELSALSSTEADFHFEISHPTNHFLKVRKYVESVTFESLNLARQKSIFPVVFYGEKKIDFRILFMRKNSWDSCVMTVALLTTSLHGSMLRNIAVHRTHQKLYKITIHMFVFDAITNHQTDSPFSRITAVVSHVFSSIWLLCDLYWLRHWVIECILLDFEMSQTGNYIKFYVVKKSLRQNQSKRMSSNECVYE